MADAAFREQLPDEVEVWQRQGIVGASQARRILAHYGLAAHEVQEAGREGRLVTILSILGALLVGIGAILFVASNWDEMGNPFRVLLLLSTLVGSYAVGYWLKFGGADHPRIGASFVFLGSLIFGANVFLIGQMYHVRANEPLLVAFWAVGVFPMAYVAASRPSLYLAALAALGWYPLQLAAWNIFTIGIGGTVGLAGFLPLGLLFLSLGEFQRTFRKLEAFASAFVRLGLVVAFLPLLVFTFADFWRSLLRSLGGGLSANWETALLQLNITFGIISVLALVATVAAAWRHGPSRTAAVQAGGVIVLGASSLLVVFHPFESPPAYAVAFNLVLLAGVLWAVMVGIWTRRESFINIGLTFFVLLVFARYFDFFFTLLDRSLVFIGAGLLLILGGFILEQYRRRLLQQMRRGGEARLGA